MLEVKHLLILKISKLNLNSKLKKKIGKPMLILKKPFQIELIIYGWICSGIMFQIKAKLIVAF